MLDLLRDHMLAGFSRAGYIVMYVVTLQVFFFGENQLSLRYYRGVLVRLCTINTFT
jgi:hypothetical protein